MAIAIGADDLICDTDCNGCNYCCIHYKCDLADFDERMVVKIITILYEVDILFFCIFMDVWLLF